MSPQPDLILLGVVVVVLAMVFRAPLTALWQRTADDREIDAVHGRLDTLEAAWAATRTELLASADRVAADLERAKNERNGVNVRLNRALASEQRALEARNAAAGVTTAPAEANAEQGELQAWLNAQLGADR